MAYEKRVCVLKQIKKGFTADGSALSGAVYAERLGKELTVTPKIAGVAPVKEGRYALVVWVGGNVYCLELGTSVKIAETPSLAGGFSALLCFVRGEAEPLAYGYTAGAPQDYSPLLSAFAEPKQKKSGEKKEREIPAAPAEEGGGDCFRKEYDDEAIADADYYRLSESGEDVGADLRAQAEAEEVEGGGDPCEDDGVPPRSVTRGTLAYYNEVKERINDAFSRFPKDDRLKAVFPRSEWVNSNGALLGIVYERGIPRYLCVAAERESAPQEMKEKGVAVPKDAFSEEGGFYVVFQDADTGDYVKVSDS